MIILDDQSGKIELLKNFDPTDSWKDFLTGAHLDQKPIRIFGKEVLQPRLTGFFGEQGVAYQYSNQTMLAEPWGGWLKNISEKCSKLSGTEFNSVLVNYYRDGQDSIGLHADDEKELGTNPNIASLSYGATRKIVFKHNKNGTKLEIILEHGDLLLMQGTLQHNWKHQLPKTKRTQEGRFNLTFRKILMV